MIIRKYEPADCNYLAELFYQTVHADYQRRGIGTAVCEALEAAAQTDKITVHASITAKPFFTSRGYTVMREQRVIREGIALTNYVMEKRRKIW